ncbi:DNA/RNA non-specific endonuclease [Prescottella subtropica]|uniref:DNA/RNA non-specific endonuclease n=1 Tax=Prescottella subtropica TaxID=2545757 RepID=UPI0010F7EDF1|nr:DNA/RNA non-specific endonuclease [Prescottella subtropica]
MATPEEDCQAVRDRDHQIWLQLIANLPPGAPIPPEPINPCIPQPQHTTTAAPAPLPGLPGNDPGQSGSGPQVGVNAPTRMPTYNGTDIVPVPGLPAPTIPGGDQPARVEGGRVTVPTTDVPSPTVTPAPTAEPATVPTPVAPDPEPESELAPGPSGTPEIVDTDEPAGTPHTLLLLLTGLAGTVAGATRFGRRPRTPESVLAQAVGVAAAPIMRYTPGQTSRLVVPEEFGLRTLFLVHDESSLHEAVIETPPVPDGGTIDVNIDGTASILDADGTEVSRMAAPWAYDTTGRAVPTRYVVRGGHLVQQVYADADTSYPILADPEDEQRKKPRNANKQTNSGWPTGQDVGAPRPQATLPGASAATTWQDLMLEGQDPSPQPSIAEAGTGSPAMDSVLADQLSAPVTSDYGDSGTVTAYPRWDADGKQSTGPAFIVTSPPDENGATQQTVHPFEDSIEPEDPWWDTEGGVTSDLGNGQFQTAYEDGTVLVAYATGRVIGTESRPNGDLITYYDDGSREIVIGETREIDGFTFLPGDSIAIDDSGRQILKPNHDDGRPRSRGEATKQGTELALDGLTHLLNSSRIGRPGAAALRTAERGLGELLDTTGERDVDTHGAFDGKIDQNRFAGRLPGSDTVEVDSGTTGKWNRLLNKPQPNTNYVVDGGDYTFQTDDRGRVVHAEGRIDDLEGGPRNGYQQRVSGRSDRKPGDEGGHIFGTQFGGPGEAINITAMRDVLNSRGDRDYYKMEMEWRNIVESGGEVHATVEIEYPEGSRRPEAYRVTWTDNSGEVETQEFLN